MALPYLIDQISKSKMSNPVTFTGNITSLPSIGVENGQISVTLTGNTVNQIIENGNLANGTTGWAGAYATLTAANNKLTVTGNGASSAIRAEQSPKSITAGKKYFLRATVLVTNSVSTNIRLFLNDGSGINNAYLLSAPTANTLYTISGIITASQSTSSGAIGLLNQYADAATANGKAMEVKEVICIDMGASASDPLYNLTAADMNSRFPYWLKYGIVSTNSVRFRSIGENKIDYKKVVPKALTGWNYGVTPTIIDNGFTFNTASAYYGVMIPVTLKPNTLHKLSGTATASTRIIVLRRNGTQYLSDGSPLAGGNINSSFTTGNDKDYWVIFDDSGTVGLRQITNLQLEEGSVATAYKPFVDGGTTYTPADIVLRKVGVAVDEYSATEGKATKNVSDYYTNVHTQTAWTIDRELTNTIRCKKAIGLTNVATPVTGNQTLKIGAIDFTLDPAYVYTNDTEGFTLGSGANEGMLYIRILKSRLATVNSAGFETWLQAQGSSSLNYQKMTVVPEKVAPPQTLIGYPNGTLIVEQITKQTLTHGEGITLLNPVKAIESITKVENNVRTPIDLTTIKLCRYASTTTTASGTTTTNITITGHGLSVGDRVKVRGVIRRVNTIVDANNVTVNAVTGMTTGDSIELYKASIVDIQKTAIIGVESVNSNNEYEIIYEYPNENSTLPTVSFVYQQNLKACVEDNTKSISGLTQSINDLNNYTVAALINMEARLVSHGI